MNEHASRPEMAQLPPTVGLIDWTHLIEDFLDPLNISFEDFRERFIGSWMFGYISALNTVGVRTVLFLVSRRVSEPLRFTHRPTGAPVCILPASAPYRAIRKRVLNPYAATVEQAVGSVSGMSYLRAALLKESAPYLSTPVWQFAREARREGCNLILCQEYEHARFDVCVLLAKIMGLPVFATFQGGDTQLGRFERLIRPLALRACDGLIIAARTEIERVCGRYRLPTTKVARIFNPVDVNHWVPTYRECARATLGIPEDARVAVWHGRVLISRKGLDVLLQAWDQVCARLPEVELRLILVGTGNDAPQLRNKIEVGQFRGITWIEGFLQDRAALRIYLSAADVYVLPSRHEGFPVAPIEAMSCGLPVVAADAPGVPDIFEDGELSGGLVVPRGDPNALAAALARVLDNDELGRQLGDRALQRARNHFSMETVGAALRDFLLCRPMRYSS